MKYHKLLFIIIIVFLYGCNKKTEPNSKQAIRDLEERFPQLIEGKNVNDRSFKHVRTVIDGQTNVQIQLYSQDERVKNNHQIIVFVNKNNRCIAIPLFNNKQRDYWQFANEKTKLDVVKVNTTFEKEYNNAISILKKENTVKNVFLEVNVTLELLQSVLHTQPIKSLDGSLEMCKIRGAVSDIPVENEDDAKERFEKNYEDIKKDLVLFYHFYDMKSYRIYRINYNEKEHKFRFKNYRQDVGAEPIKPIYL